MNSKQIFCPIHGFISITPLMQKIIDTPEFKRLHNLRQAGIAYLVFPSANHTRFEHSIGVSHLAGKLITHLKINQPELNISDSRPPAARSPPSSPSAASSPPTPPAAATPPLLLAPPSPSPRVVRPTPTPTRRMLKSGSTIGRDPPQPAARIPPRAAPPRPRPGSTHGRPSSKLTHPVSSYIYQLRISRLPSRVSLHTRALLLLLLLLIWNSRLRPRG